METEPQKIPASAEFSYFCSDKGEAGNEAEHGVCVESQQSSADEYSEQFPFGSPRTELESRVADLNGFIDHAVAKTVKLGPRSHEESALWHKMHAIERALHHRGSISFDAPLHIDMGAQATVAKEVTARNIDPKHKRFAAWVVVILAAGLAYSLYELITSVIGARSDPPISVTRQNAVNRVHFPYLTLCSWEFLSPGMREDWFSNADAHLYHDWSDIYGKYQDTALDVSYVNASTYSRDSGVCLQVDAHDLMMENDPYYDWFSLSFDFTPSYDEFCAKFAEDDSSTCEYYSDTAGNVVGGGYVTEELELILEYDRLDYTKADAFYVGYEDKEILVNVKPTRSTFLDQSTTYSSNYDIFSNKLINLRNHTKAGTYRVHGA
mmetsp:Transcript_17057/g.39982  ORF Transcript_17057/g.39982 Transcript_17057/m.39982 type:complete len:379 (+) Transcript_17057:446-1582(+)